MFKPTHKLVSRTYHPETREVILAHVKHTRNTVRILITEDGLRAVNRFAKDPMRWDKLGS